MGTDAEWQRWGLQDPYFGVLTHERFRQSNLTPQTLDEFFQIGKRELLEIVTECRRYVGDVSLSRTLDFGCGVGRLLIPLAQMSGQSVGVDISDPMRVEAERNCARFHCNNVRLISRIEELGSQPGGFTFVNTYIVLQHIDPARGLEIVDKLLRLLDHGGAAAIHVVYGRRKYQDNLGAQPPARQWVGSIRRPLSRLSRRLRGRDPEMQMNAYNLNRLMFLMQQHGVPAGGFRLTDHGGYLGALFFLKRP